eukprot:Em0016g215a
MSTIEVTKICYPEHILTASRRCPPLSSPGNRMTSSSVPLRVAPRHPTRRLVGLTRSKRAPGSVGRHRAAPATVTRCSLPRMASSVPTPRRAGDAERASSLERRARSRHKTSASDKHTPPPVRSRANAPSTPTSLQSTLTDGSLNSSLHMPLLTSSLRKGGSKPSVGTQWERGGLEELEAYFPDHQVRIFTATWNMHEERELPASLDDMLLPTSHPLASDIYVIGTQESTPSRKEWEVLIQQTLGPNYVMVSSSSLGVIYLIFFLRKDLLWFCSAVYTESYATRIVSAIKTKGGVGLCFTLFGSSFLFVTSHLTAHQGKVPERNSDVQRIMTNLTFFEGKDGTTFVPDRFNYVFWIGDLNYRIDVAREETDQLTVQSNWTNLLLKDQLTREILQGHVFQGFSEQPISFPPTYKYDLNSDVFDSSEKRRTPSWTDRILFKSQSGSGIIGCSYDSCRTVRCSDHRPVYAMFTAELSPSNNVDGIPDTIASFDREVYVKAHRQRKSVAELTALLQQEETDGGNSPPVAYPANRHVTSSVCAIL